MLPANELFQQLINSFGVEITKSHLLIYFALMLAVMIEGPVAILIGATAASSGFLNPVPVFLAASLGNLFGDVGWYLLGFTGKLEWVLRFRFLRLDMKKISFLKKSISKHVIKIIAVAKLTNGLIVPALIATGLARVSIRRWFPVIFFINLVTTGIFVALGFFTAVNLMKFDHWLRYIVLVFSFIILILVTIFIRKWFSHYYSIEDILAEENGTETI